jgi:hypothetical protein
MRHDERVRLMLVLAALLGGLHGVVTRGPTMPVCRAGTPCSAPAPGAVLIFSRNGRIAARSRAGTGGRYAVTLPAGVYTVTLSPKPRIGFGIRPLRVHTVAGVDARLDFAVDSGIR